MLSTIVKISNVTNLSDARYCAGMGVEMLGFSLDPDGQNYVSPARFSEIKGWLAGVSLVGETDLTDLALIREVVKDYDIDMLQVGSPEILPLLAAELEMKMLLRVNTDLLLPGDLSSLITRYAGNVAYFVLESDTGGAEPGAELTAEMRTLTQIYPVLYGLERDQQAAGVAELIETWGLKGIAIRGGEEIRPGYKDFGAMMDILEALEVD